MSWSNLIMPFAQMRRLAPQASTLFGSCRCLALVGLSLLLAGCISSPPTSEQKPPSRYEKEHDSAPAGIHELEKIPDAVPRIEPMSRGGNRSPYRIGANTYHIMPTSAGYAETGLASWYGSKFHGHLTSNGEVYNMFDMSAAHKTLPLPTYLQVTNIANGRQVIVRVNDRGPFHSDRILDLSYAAAAKLGFVNQGTARVRIEAIDPEIWQQRYIRANSVAPAGPIYLQVGAFSSQASAEQLKQRVSALTSKLVSVHLDRSRNPALHKVHVGPFDSLQDAESEKALIAQNGLGAPIIVAAPPT